MLSNTLSLAIGVGLGIYIAQNYNVPDIRVLFNHGLKVVNSFEKAARKEDDDK